ncbi:hypothetical protein [Candidatus Electronema sp. TJ]|uniref:hypothetical protein n=1 Tax=Candidatus Electronema sp. TJ TaxID=3401573 RepID=UPI003AA8608F
MQQVKQADEKIGYAEKKKIVARLDMPCVPREDKNRAGDNDAEYFRQGMEEQVIAKANQMQAQRDEKQGEAGQGEPVSVYDLRSGIHVPEQEGGWDSWQETAAACQ